LCLDQVVDSHDEGVGAFHLVEMHNRIITLLTVNFSDDPLAHVSDKFIILHPLLNELEVLSLELKLLPLSGQSFIKILFLFDELIYIGLLKDLLVGFLDLDGARVGALLGLEVDLLYLHILLLLLLRFVAFGLSLNLTLLNFDDVVLNLSFEVLLLGHDILKRERDILRLLGVVPTLPVVNILEFLLF
jgi:hypothetical protein